MKAVKSYAAQSAESPSYERTLKGDVHYRFVIDMKSLN